MTQAEINEFKLSGVEKQIEFLWEEINSMKTEVVNLRISAAKSSVITGIIQAVGTVLIIWLFRSALFGG